MSAAIRKSPAAERDLLDIFVFIGLDSLEAAGRFLECSERSFEFLASNPGLGRPFPVQSRRLKGLRRWPVHGFPNHLVFYLPPRNGAIEIVRVMHGARDLHAALLEPLD